MMKILLIGNSGILTNDKGGQTAKLRLYKKKIIDEGFELSFVDLEHFFKNALHILRKIKKEMAVCDRVVLISGERACRLLIPYINRINKKRKIPFVLPLVGSGVLHFSIDHLTSDEQLDFFEKKHYYLARKKKTISKELRKITYILPETETMKGIYQDFYDLNNCFVLNNFREIPSIENKKYLDNPVKLIFLSRVMKQKGIFDLIEAVQKMNKVSIRIKLDIFGELHLNNQEKNAFNNSIGQYISYRGIVDNDKVIPLINKYDLFVFPTRFSFEGTPGVISESLIAGTPVLTSDFPQAKKLLINGFDSLFYKMFSKDDLVQKLEYALGNKDLLLQMRQNANESGEKFSYEYSRNLFLKYICGVE